MKVCVVGAGFTGTITAISLKLNCPNIKVIQIDSDKEPHNLGFGEGGPPDFMQNLFRALHVPQSQRAEWTAKFLADTHSTVKYNLKWQNFNNRDDEGWYSGMPDLPDHRIIYNSGHTTRLTNSNFINVNEKDYLLSDLWYELYQQGRRSYEDFQGDINSLYWFCKDNTMHSAGNDLVSNMPSVHINSYECCTWLKTEYEHVLDQVIVGTVQDIQVSETGSITGLQLDNGNIVSADFFIDCTGFKRIFAKKFNLQFHSPSTEIVHNSVVVVGNGYTENIDKELQPYTTGWGMDYGWTFGIPLLNRQSYGYSYHSDFITADQALEELVQHSDPATRVFDPLNIKWSPGGYKETWRNNWCLMGLAAGFVDPFDANTIALQFKQIFILMKFFNNLREVSRLKKKYNDETWQFLECVAERVELHHGLAPRNTSDYWRRNKEVAQKKDLHNRVFDVLDEYIHTPAAVDKQEFIPYPTHLYLTETLYYGIDMSRRCRQSSHEVLKLAEEYFKSHNSLNRLRSSISPSMREWYQQQGIDLDQFVKFRK